MRDELFRKVFEESSIGMAFAGLDGKLLRTNKHFCDMLGYTPSELTGKNFSDVTHPEDILITRSFFNNIAKNPNHSYRLEKRYIHKTGKPVWTEVTATLLCDSDGKPLFVVAQMLDISARKEFEEEQKIVIDILDLINSSATWRTCCNVAPRISKLNSEWKLSASACAEGMTSHLSQQRSAIRSALSSIQVTPFSTNWPEIFWKALFILNFRISPKPEAFG